MPLLDRIQNLQDSHSLSKHEILVQGIVETIGDEELLVGDRLPSINTMVKEVGYARKTIVRAYEELKVRGLVESKDKQGYFIVSQETGVVLRVALLLFAFQSFQEDFYNTFRNELGEKFQVDVFFHHNNISIFETMISNLKGKYGMYVIAPIQDDRLKPLLQTIPSNKLLLVDRYLDLGSDYSYIAQEFENSTYGFLVKLLPEVKKYKQMILLFNPKTDYSPIEVRNAFEKFIEAHGVKGCVEEKYALGTLQTDTLYFVKSDSTLWKFLKDCTRKKYVLGKDLGVVSYDDNVLKEIILGGITTMSIDFKEMAKIAANHVKNGTETRMIIPSNLIRRNSL
ncbi:GntR family transcriptional regulator [Flagellimonas amphidinii]|nr:substrate-binding domain-containing protein [Allomuricauda amphidinii]MDC6365895.1 GntR family transcriptional regulator [Muricauda sp. AC10]